MTIVAALVVVVLAQAPQRDALRTDARSGTIAGRVVDADTAAPLRNARIGLVPEEGDEPDPVLTDAEGRFRIANLPPGRYTLVASKPGYVSLRYGARRALDRPRPVEVPGDGSPIDIRLPRGAALSGRLVDDLGEPMPDVRVTAGVVIRTSAGTRITAIRSADTDDLGEYRIAGLPPGTYIVSARPGPSIPDGGIMFGMDPAANAPTYERLYYPSTPSVAQARQLPLRAGDDLSDIDVTFRQIRRPRLSITVRDAAGAPASGFVQLISDMGGGALGRQVRIDGSGSATLPIDPGDWLIQASGDAGTAVVPLTVGEADADVSVVLTRGTTLTGRIVYEGAPKPSVPVRVSEGSAIMPMFVQAPPSRIAPDGTFTIDHVRDIRQLRIEGLPAGWRLKGIYLDGVDLLAGPPPEATQLAGVTIVLTAVHSEVSGTVIGERGAPVPDAEVLIYPRDPALLVNADRWARWVRADRRGAFVVRDLPTGSYLAVALADVDGSRWSTAEYLNTFRRSAIAFTLNVDDRRMIAVPFVREPQRP